MASNGRSGSKRSSGSSSRSSSRSSGSSSGGRSSSGSSRSSGSSGGSGSRGGGSRQSQDSKPAPGKLARSARAQLAELTGRMPESVLGLRRDDDGWMVMVEVVELSRVPNSTDLLGLYAVMLDEEGELLGYERVRRYQRGQTGGEE